MADYEQVGGHNPDGMKIGRDSTATGKIAFFNGTPVIRQTAASAVTGASDTTAITAAITALSLALHNYNLTN